MKLQVKSLREGGFCRLGVKWPAEGKVVDSTEYTDEQWERLMKEPNLKVESAPEDGTGQEVVEEVAGDSLPPAATGEVTGDGIQGEAEKQPAATTQTTKGNGGRKTANAGA